MNRGVVILLIIGLLLVYIHPLFAQNSEPIDKLIENKIKSGITSTKETIKQGFFNNLRKTGTWIRFNLTQKLIDWWDLKGKPYILSLWHQLIKLLNREVYL